MIYLTFFLLGIEWQDDDDDFDGPTNVKASGDKRDATRQSQDRDEKEGSPSNGSVGKLKLSHEMKEKLEAVTGSRKNSVRSNASQQRPELEIAAEGLENLDGAARKLSENKKLLMEQKLGGSAASAGK